MKKKSDVEFLEYPLSFKEATEPTNIIWENRRLGLMSRTTRKIIVLMLVTLFLAGAVIVFFLLKRETIIN